MTIVAIDPGQSATALAVVEARQARVALRHVATIKEKTCRALVETLTAEIGPYVVKSRVIVEFPSPRYFGRPNTKHVIATCRVAAEIGRGIARKYGVVAEFFDANHLTYGGRIVPNRDRKPLFTRIFGDVRTNEHVRDAALIAAKTFNFF